MLSMPWCQFLLSHSLQIQRCLLTMLTEPRCHGSLSFWCKTWCKNRRKKALCPRTKRLRFRYYSLFMLSISNIIPFVNRKSENFQKNMKNFKIIYPTFPTPELFRHRLQSSYVFSHRAHAGSFRLIILSHNFFQKYDQTDRDFLDRKSVV